MSTPKQTELTVNLVGIPVPDETARQLVASLESFGHREGLNAAMDRAVAVNAADRRERQMWTDLVTALVAQHDAIAALVRGEWEAAGESLFDSIHALDRLREAAEPKEAT
jgi:hypothetical protein